jgi:phosphatidylglycerol:prolipoprotein diacylglycerol transferase
MAGLVSWWRLGRKENKDWDFNFFSDLLLWGMIAGVVGARLLFVMSDLPHFLSDPLSIFYIHQGGLVYYGALLGGWLAMLWYARRNRVRLIKFHDLIITSVPLGHAFGRMGCFLNGCCYGKLHDGLCGVTYPLTSSAGETHYWAGLIGNETVFAQMGHYLRGNFTDGEFLSALRNNVAAGRATWAEIRSAPVHPVQLYESAFNICLYIFLVWAYRHRKRDGMIIGLYFLIYPVGRFMLEFFRGDERTYAGGLSVAQWIGLALLAIGMGFLTWSFRHGRDAFLNQKPTW